MAGPGDFARKASTGGNGPSFIDRVVAERMAYDAELERLYKVIEMQNGYVDEARYNGLRHKRLVKVLQDALSKIDPENDALKLEYLDM